MGPLQLCPETVPSLPKKCFPVVHGQNLHCPGCTGAFTSLLHHSLSVVEPLLMLAQYFWTFYPRILCCTNHSFCSRTWGFFLLLPAKRVSSNLALPWLSFFFASANLAFLAAYGSSGFIWVYSRTPQT